MRIIVSRTYFPRNDTFGLSLDIQFDDEDDPMTRSVVERDFTSLSTIFRREFDTHGELYNIIDPRFLTEMSFEPNGSRFDTNSEGFEKFVGILTQRQVEMVGRLVSDLISNRLTYIEEQYGKETETRVAINLKRNEPDKDALKEIDQIHPATLIINDKAYAMELKEVEGVETFEDMKAEVYKTIKADYESQFESLKKIHGAQMSRLRAQMEQARTELFVDILKNAQEIFTDWSFEEIRGELYLKYKHRIVVDKVIKNRTAFDYPDQEGLKELYVSGLRVRVVPFVSANDVRVTRGFNLHFTGTSGCIGDLAGKPLIQVLKELPRALKIANMDSPLNSEVTSYLRTFLSRQDVPNFPEATAEGDLGW